MKEFRNENEKYFDVRNLLEQVQESEDWQCASLKEPLEDMDDELIYYNKKLNLAFKFIIDAETNTVGMKKINPDILEIKTNKKSI